MNDRDLAVWLSCFTAAVAGADWLDRLPKDRKRIPGLAAKMADQMLEEFKSRELGVRKV